MGAKSSEEEALAGRNEGAGTSIPCPESPGDCEQITPAPAEEFLRQALGSNDGDVRLPSLLLSLAALLAIVARLLLRSWARRGSSAEPGSE